MTRDWNTGLLVLPIVPTSTPEQQAALQEQFRQATEVLRQLRPDVFIQQQRKDDEQRE